MREREGDLHIKHIEISVQFSGRTNAAATAAAGECAGKGKLLQSRRYMFLAKRGHRYIMAELFEFHLNKWCYKRTPAARLALPPARTVPTNVLLRAPK